jgi:hypothetical protein
MARKGEEWFSTGTYWVVNMPGSAPVQKLDHYNAQCIFSPIFVHFRVKLKLSIDIFNYNAYKGHNSQN